MIKKIVVLVAVLLFSAGSAMACPVTAPVVGNFALHADVSGVAGGSTGIGAHSVTSSASNQANASVSYTPTGVVAAGSTTGSAYTNNTSAATAGYAGNYSATINQVGNYSLKK